MTTDTRSVFLSHSSLDMGLTSIISSGLKRSGFIVFLDPFQEGDRLCLETERSIKRCTHFVLILTKSAAESRWVFLEALFARRCQRRGAIEIIPVYLDRTPPMGSISEFKGFNWESSKCPDELVKKLAKRISETMPSAARLGLDVEKSQELKEQGRELERRAAIYDKSALLLAEDKYEEAIDWNYCNHNAWANLAWVLWKRGEDQRAWKYIRIARQIRPDSSHVRDVLDRMEGGQRSIGN